MAHVLSVAAAGHFCGVRQQRTDAELAPRVPEMARDLQRMHSDLSFLYHKEARREWLEKPTPQYVVLLLPFHVHLVLCAYRNARRPQPMIFDRGQRGRREEQFLYPRAVVAHPREGDLYVADAGNHRVIELNSAGIVKSVFGSRGSGARSFYFDIASTR